MHYASEHTNRFLLANFSTHITGSTVISAALGTALLTAKIINLPESFLLILIGALSGLLPDLDADDSTSIGWLFSILAFVTAGSFLAIYPLKSLLGIWMSVGLIFFAIWFIVKPLFEAITVHRGSLHSLLATLMFSLLGGIISIELHTTLNFALLVSVFIAVGAITHLILDECYSVDLSNTRLKSSFGSAMKIIDIRFPTAVTIQSLITAGACYYLYQHAQQAVIIVAEWQSKLSQLSLMPSL